MGATYALAIEGITQITGLTLAEAEALAADVALACGVHAVVVDQRHTQKETQYGP